MKNSRNAVDDRQMQILDMVRDRREVKVEELANTFGISLMTVRRDLKLLEDKKKLVRTHGGAISLDKASQLISQSEKISLCRESISKFAAQYVDDGDSLFINGSRTALNMLRYVENKKVTVVTNNCWGIGEKYPQGVTMHYTGGEVRSNIMIGEYVMRNLLSMSADKTFLGCAAVYEDGEFRYDIPTEIGINEAMISHTRKGLYILADHTKIMTRESRESVYGSCTYECECTLITDRHADTAVLERLRKRDINVIVVP